MIKQNHLKTGKKEKRIEKRRQEADARQIKYDDLSLAEKMKINPKKYMRGTDGKIVKVKNKEKTWKVEGLGVDRLSNSAIIRG